MSSDNAEFAVRQSPVTDTMLRMLSLFLTHNSCSSESVLIANFGHSTCSCIRGKSKRGRVSPALYVTYKKWKVILHYETSKTTQLDPEDRKYDQYQQARNWMEKSCMKMLPVNA